MFVLYGVFRRNSWWFSYMEFTEWMEVFLFFHEKCLLSAGIQTPHASLSISMWRARCTKEGRGKPS